MFLLTFRVQSLHTICLISVLFYQRFITTTRFSKLISVKVFVVWTESCPVSLQRSLYVDKMKFDSEVAEGVGTEQHEFAK